MAAVRTEPVLRFIRELAVRGQSVHLTDRELLLAFVTTHDEHSFAALLRRHGAMVLRVCLHVLHDEHDAEDAFQATFLVLSRKAVSVQKQESVGSWLFGVAQRVATNLKRSRSRQRIRDSRVSQLEPVDPLAEISVREAQAILYEELNRLPEKYRSPLVLCTLEGMTRDEAAHHLGWPLHQLKNCLESARKRLRERLAARGVGLAGALIASVFCEQSVFASVPVTLLNSTTKAATTVAAGGAVTAVVSTKVAALAQGVIKAMFLSKLQNAAIGFVVILMTFGLASIFVAHATIVHGQAPEAKELRANESRVAVYKESVEQEGSGWKSRATLQGHKDEVICVAFGVEQFATASKDGTIKLWDMTTNKELRACKYPLDDGLINHMEFTADGKHVLMCFGNHFGFWDITKEVFPKAIVIPATPLGTAASGKNGHILAFRGDSKQGADGTRLLVGQFGGFVHAENDVLGFREVKNIGPYQHKAKIELALVSDDGALVASSTEDRTITVWDVATEKQLALCKGYKEKLLSIALSLDAKTLASAGSDGTVLPFYLDNFRIVTSGC